MTIQSLIDQNYILIGTNDPIDKILVQLVLENVYNKSGEFQSIMDGIPAAGRPLIINFTTGEPKSIKGEYIVKFNPHFDGGYVTNQGNVVAFSAERQMVHEIVHAINNLSDPTGDFSLPNPDYVGETVRLTNTIMASMGLDELERPTYAASVPNRFIGRDMTGNATVDVVLTTSIEVGLGYPGHNLNTTLNTTLLRDLMIGGRGDSEFYSGRGNDFIYAGGGVDTIDAGEDDDHVFGESGNDLVYGGSGNDCLDGGADTDTLTYENLSLGVHINLDQATTGDLGANFTSSGAGPTGGWIDHFTDFENLTLTSSDDTVSVDKTNLADLTIDAGDNQENGDTADFSGLGASGGITFDLGTGNLNVTEEGNHLNLLNFENVVGSSHNDTITGSEASNILYGGDGADSLSGGAGGDIYSYPAGAEKCWEANCIKNITIAFSIFIAGINPVYAETIKDTSAPLACSHFTPDADYINITLVMQLEEREVAMRVPQEFLEDAWNRQEGARKTAFLFRTMIDTFEPVARSQTPYLDFEYTSFLTNDYIDLPKLAELMLDLASPGKASPSEPLSAYDTHPFQYGLIEVIPNYPKELQENVYLQMGRNGAVNTVIACSVVGTVAFPGCQQFSRTPSGVDIKFHYRLKYLPIWQDMQNNIHSFVECAIDDANKERQ